MGQPSDEDVQTLLISLEEVGVVQSWKRRPLGIYHIYEWDGDLWTFDRKEAMLWAQGAMGSLAFVHHASQSSQFGAHSGVEPPVPTPSRPAGPPYAPPSPATEGWKTDPTGRFDQRFWDGERWTKRVLRDRS